MWLSKHHPSATPSTTFNLHDLPCGYQNIVHQPLPAPLLTYMIYLVAIKTSSISHSQHHFQPTWFTLWLSKHRPSATPSTTFNLHDLPCDYQNIVHQPLQHHFQPTWFTLWLSKHRPSATPSTTFNLHDLPCGYQNIVHQPLPAPPLTYMIYLVAIKTPSIVHSQHHFQSTWFTLWLSKHRPSTTLSTTFNLHDLPCGYQNIVHQPLPAPLLTYMIYLVAIKTSSISHSQHHL